MPIQFEWLDGENTCQISLGAYTVTRGGLATGLSAFAPLERTLRVTQDPQCPAPGSAHPYFTGLAVSDIRVELDNPDSARIAVTYTTPSFNLIQSQPDPANNPRAQSSGATEIGASVLADSTAVDNAGNRLSVDYLVASVRQSDGSFVALQSSYTDTQYPEVEIFRPQMVLRKSTYQAASPFVLAATFVGTVNSAAIWGFPARTLLCRQITGRYEGDGTQYLVEYEFEYRAATWDVRITWLDPVSGETPANVTAAGNKLVRIYPETAYSLLGLSF